MNDLTKFNLKDHNFSVTLILDRLSVDDFSYRACIFNMDEQVGFAHPHAFTNSNDAENFKHKVFNRGVVDLTKWEAEQDFFEYTDKSDIDNGFVNVLAYS